ncbi:hypothetical protein VTO73DRAFT_1619 [Trametes versicolor]
MSPRAGHRDAAKARTFGSSPRLGQISWLNLNYITFDMSSNCEDSNISSIDSAKRPKLQRASLSEPGFRAQYFD